MGDLSIVRVEEELELEATTSDVVGVLMRSLAAYVPKLGPILANIVGVAIPNQKLDRVIAFIKVLGDRVKYLEEDVAKKRMETPEFAVLLEDGLSQASRALTDERRQYIASLLSNSLTTEHLKDEEEKKLLWLLGELNDAEVLMLKFHSLSLKHKQAFAALHEELFAPLNSRDIQRNVEKKALRDSYRARLTELGLIEPVFKRPDQDKLPEFDLRTGRIKATDYRATGLGKLLLRLIEPRALSVVKNIAADSD